MPPSLLRFELCRVDAGKVELDGASYAGLPLPFSISQLVWIEAILVGGAEVYRNTELDPEKRLYPGALLSFCIHWMQNA
jgi:light-harvesting complex II chlorophyll a/b binding protein 4